MALPRICVSLHTRFTGAAEDDDDEEEDFLDDDDDDDDDDDEDDNDDDEDDDVDDDDDDDVGGAAEEAAGAETATGSTFTASFTASVAMTMAAYFTRHGVGGCVRRLHHSRRHGVLWQLTEHAFLSPTNVRLICGTIRAAHSRATRESSADPPGGSGQERQRRKKRAHWQRALRSGGMPDLFDDDDRTSAELEYCNRSSAACLPAVPVVTGTGRK